MDTLPTKRPSPPWFWIASIWLGVGLFDGTQTVVVMRAEGMHHAWTELFITLVLSWLPWTLATPVVLWLGRRYPPVGRKPVSAWLRHATACAGVGAVSSAWSAWLETLLNPWAKSGGPGPFRELWFDRFYGGLLSFFILYGSILAVSYILDSRERLGLQRAETARLNEQLAKAQLQTLRHQIEPHFLFNTLNAIAGLVREKRNDAAVSMIVGLSDFLRRVLDDSSKQQVRLGDEMEFVRRYLDIQKVRFADRLRLRVDVPEDLCAAQVPSLILQPMVENAIKHGIAKRAQGGLIRIAAARDDGFLTLSVYNDGPRLPEDWSEARSGIGISNVRSRLRGLYGDTCRLSLRNHEPDGVEASVSVPYKKG